MTDRSGNAARDRRGSTQEAEEIADLLSEIGRSFKAQLRAMPDSPARALSPPQRDVLVRIGRRPGSTPASISERTGRDPGQVTRLVAELEALGLALRARSTQDRRSVTLTLSQEGQALFGDMLARRAALSRDMLSGIGSDEMERFRATLIAIRGRLRTMSDVR